MVSGWILYLTFESVSFTRKSDLSSTTTRFMVFLSRRIMSQSIFDVIAIIYTFITFINSCANFIALIFDFFHTDLTTYLICFNELNSPIILSIFLRDVKYFYKCKEYTDPKCRSASSIGRSDCARENQTNKDPAHPIGESFLQVRHSCTIFGVVDQADPFSGYLL